MSWYGEREWAMRAETRSPGGTFDPAPTGERPRRHRVAETVLQCLAGVAGMVAGWWLAVPLLYVAGLSIVVLIVVRQVSGRTRLIALAVLAAVALGAPWLMIRAVHRVDGQPVAVELRDAVVVPAADGGTWLRDGWGVRLLDPEGEVLWRQPKAGRYTTFSVLSPEFLWYDMRSALGPEESPRAGVLGPDGQERWSMDGTGEWAVAGDGEVIVGRSCVDGGCELRGRSAPDGAQVWSLPSGLAHGVPEALRAADFGGESRVYASAWFLADEPGVGSGIDQDPDGEDRDAADQDEEDPRALRHVSTGEVLHRLTEEELVWAAGEVAFVVDSQACTMRVVRPEGVQEPAPADCDFTEAVGEAALEYRSAGQIGRDRSAALMARSGDAVLVVGSAGEAFVIDAGTSQVRREERVVLPFSTPDAGSASGLEAGMSIMGAGVLVDAEDDQIVVRDAVSARQRWSLPVPAGELHRVWADGDVVVIERDGPRDLPLEEWLAPRDRSARVTEIYRAEDGERVARPLRAELTAVPRISGERVLLATRDDSGAYEGWMIGD